MTRVKFEDFDMDARTRDMLIAARVVCKAPLVITQGCYNAGGVAASAGTHDGGGALDIRAVNLDTGERLEVVSWLRHVGFAASLRSPTEGKWPWHIHCIAVGCPDLSRGAKNQATAYKNGRNGLANNGPDKGTRAWVDWTWERYKKTYPNLLTEDIVQQSDIDKIVAAVVPAVVAKMTPVVQSFSAFNAKNLTQQLGHMEAFVTQLAASEDVVDDKEVAALKTALATLQAKVDTLPKV